MIREYILHPDGYKAWPENPPKRWYQVTPPPTGSVREDPCPTGPSTLHKLLSILKHFANMTDKKVSFQFVLNSREVAQVRGVWGGGGTR